MKEDLFIKTLTLILNQAIADYAIEKQLSLEDINATNSTTNQQQL